MITYLIAQWNSLVLRTATARSAREAKQNSSLARHALVISLTEGKTGDQCVLRKK